VTASGGPDQPGGVRRRTLLKLAGAASAGGLLGGGAFAGLSWLENFQRSATFVARAPDYGGDLETPMLEGLRELGIGRAQLRDKRVLLKPNLVEPRPGAEHVNTHPHVIRAAAEVFRRLDAAEVFVAEGSGHCRDTHLVLEQSGLEPVLREERLSFIDLNHEDAEPLPNRGGFTTLDRLFLPRALLASDWVVSVPKLKTHHWTGVTLSMKNLFGVMPGLIYGWPKNVLHYRGIVPSILDIVATVRPQLAIVDGIVGMEGDGPIMGTPRAAGLLLMGTNPTAVDATGARLMGFEPFDLPFLRFASGVTGPVGASHIEQRGELPDELAQVFALPGLEHFRQFRPTARTASG